MRRRYRDFLYTPCLHTCTAFLIINSLECYRFSKDGPTLTHYGHPQSIAHCRPHSWCCMLYACMLSHFCCVQLLAVLWIIACQTPLSMRFCRREYWSGFPCSLSGDLPDPRLEPKARLCVPCTSRQVLYY